MTWQQPVSVHFPDRPVPIGVWIFAAVIALFCHLTFGALAIARMQEEPEQDELGAPGMEIAFELASIQMQASDLPPGPDRVESAASPPVVQQTAAASPDFDQLKEIPVEVEDADRSVQIDTIETSDDEPTVGATMVTASDEFVAQEASAPPALPEIRIAETVTTRDLGTGESTQRARLIWQRELLAHLNRYKRYPAERSQKSVEILVTLDLDRAGQVLAATVAQGSGDEAFDRAALAMIERANPVPPPPPLIADEGLSFSLPVHFRKNPR